MVYRHTIPNQIRDHDELSDMLWDILPEITDTIDTTTNLLNVRKKDLRRSVDNLSENTTVPHRHGILQTTLMDNKV
ncbi:MAG: hypothetical protein AAGF95_03435 [Chloroflexota bacterium]